MSGTSAVLLPPLPGTPSAPAFLLQTTELGPSATLCWVGTCAQVGAVRPSAGRTLGREWACAMPGPAGAGQQQQQAVGTTLYRAPTAPTDVALPIALRLSRKLDRQILLSLALPPSLTAPSAATPGADPNGPCTLVHLEGQLLRYLRARGADGAVGGTEAKAGGEGAAAQGAQAARVVGR